MYVLQFPISILKFSFFFNLLEIDVFSTVSYTIIAHHFLQWIQEEWCHRLSRVAQKRNKGKG